MKVLITGAGQFLGSHLVDRLIAENEEVVALDPAGGKGFISNNARVYKHDYKSGNVAKVFAKEHPDVVCHFAAEDTIMTSFEHPMKNVEHIRYSLRLFELCKQYKVKRVIYASSSAVYGNPQYLPCDEQHPTHPVSPLGIAQRAVENYLSFYWINFGLDHAILRTANVYGPRQTATRSGGIIAILAGRMLKADKVIINGDGMQERDFVFFSDIMDAALKAIKLPARKDKRAAPTDFIFNLGTGKSFSINTVFEILKERISYNKKPVRGPQRPCEVFEMRLHARHAETALRWEPKVSLEQGIEKTLLWFKKKLRV